MKSYDYVVIKRTIEVYDVCMVTPDYTEVIDVVCSCPLFEDAKTIADTLQKSKESK